MQTLSEHMRERSEPGQTAPLYVRWDPENGPFAIELKLETVAAITAEIERAGETDVELGGIFIGTLPSDGNNILRINDVQIIPRRTGDQRAFVLDPRDRDRFVLARWEAGNKGRVPVGFFRTHLRSGAMRPSLADHTLLAGEFDSAAYVLLLISPELPRTAALFAGSRGELAEQPSVAPFRFEPRELGRLPEAEPDITSRSKDPAAMLDVAAPSPEPSAPAGAETPVPQTTAPRRSKTSYLASILLLLTLIAAAYAWSDLPHRGLLSFSAAADPGLSITGDRVLHISWNHSAPAVTAATGGKLTITDGDSRRELLVTATELRGGSVEYQSASGTVQVTLTLELPNSNVSQTATHHQ